MDPTAILTSVLVLGGVGLVFGSLIALANQRFRVWEDPRITGVVDLLPGNNCGACGFPGCRGFAEGLVGGDTAPAKCTVMGPEGVEQVAGYLGVSAGEVEKQVARLLCAGGIAEAPVQAEYRGVRTCAAAAAVAGGGKACSWGCLGLADCEVACDFEAIHMNANGLPQVDPERCTACGDCVEACPKDLFVLMPASQRLLVQCKSLLEGDEAEARCKVACTGCGKCALDAAPGLIEICDGLAHIDVEKAALESAEATKRCPTGAIVWLEGEAQFAGELVARSEGT